MAIVRRAYTADGTDRTNGTPTGLTGGGVLVEAAPSAGVFLVFDRDGQQLPAITGRKYRRDFSELAIHHASGVEGAIVLVAFDCGEDVEDAPPSYAGDATAAQSYDVSLASPFLALGAAPQRQNETVPARLPGVFRRGGLAHTDAAAGAFGVYASGGTAQYGLVEGRQAIALNPGAGAGGAGLVKLAANLLVSPASVADVVDDAEAIGAPRVWRVIARFAAAAPLFNYADDVDRGFMLVHSRNASVTNNSLTCVEGGFGVQQRGDGTWNLVRRLAGSGAFGGGGYTIVAAGLPISAVNRFNTVEFRIVGAAPDLGASRAELWINGAYIGTYNLDGVTLPTAHGSTNTLGFIPMLGVNNGNAGGNTGQLYPLAGGGLRVIAGPTLASVGL